MGDMACSGTTVTALDRLGTNVRINKAKAFVRPRDVVVDVGCADGTLFERLQGSFKYGIGVDPLLEEKLESQSYTLYPGRFPDAVPTGTKCDVITMLAVLEHIPPAQQAKLSAFCHDLLNDGGRIVITVPSPRVDGVLHLLLKLRLSQVTSAHEHYGYKPEHTPNLFPAPNFRLAQHKRFQFGLNNLFVFEKT
jgi:2-polyprenyl-3-methyl-5-hydroxy-6-metoxy-1,4-benzoquinol methylase